MKKIIALIVGTGRVYALADNRATLLDSGYGQSVHGEFHVTKKKYIHRTPDTLTILDKDKAQVFTR